MNFKEMFEKYEETSLPQMIESAGMSADQLAKNLGLSRQRIHKILNQAITKVYNLTRRDMPDLSPFETVVAISRAFNIDDLEDIWKILPVNIAKEVEADAKKRL